MMVKCPRCNSKYNCGSRSHPTKCPYCTRLKKIYTTSSGYVRKSNPITHETSLSPRGKSNKAMAPDGEYYITKKLCKSHKQIKKEQKYLWDKKIRKITKKRNKRWK